jgi:hypothetical protein
MKKLTESSGENTRTRSGTQARAVNIVVSLLTYCSAGDPFLFWESVDLSSPVDHQLRKDYRSQR